MKYLITLILLLCATPAFAVDLTPVPSFKSWSTAAGKVTATKPGDTAEILFPGATVTKSGKSISVTIPSTTGPQGPQGLAGTAGVKGDPGATGPTGPQGIQGLTGLGLNWRDNWSGAPTGYVKDDAVLNIFDMSSYRATAYSSGNRPDLFPLTWALIASKGGAGATGATGPQGIQGVKGDTGPQGIQGVAGAQGTAGTTGSTGATGATGSAGIQGPAGAKGDKGDTGNTGATGPVDTSTLTAFRNYTAIDRVTAAQWSTLGNSATRNVGTVAGSVAAGDDARMVAFANNSSAYLRKTGSGAGLTGVVTAINLANDFGAVANGTLVHSVGTDNYTAITAALTSAMTTGKALYIPAGIYRTAPLAVTIPTGKKLKIFGEGTLFIDDDTPNKIAFQISGQAKSSTEEVNISGIKIVRYNTNVRYFGNVTLMVYRVASSDIDGIEITGSSLISLMTNDCKRSVVRSCKIHNSVVGPNCDGISMNDTDQLIITDNQVWNVGDDGIAVANNGSVTGIFDSIIANNIIRRDSGWCAVAVCGGHGIDIVGGMNNIAVTGNVISIADNYEGIGAWMATASTSDMTNINISYNIITSYGSPAWINGISLRNDIATHEINRVKISDNVVTGLPIGINAGGLSTGYTNYIKNIEITRNIISGTGTIGINAKYVDGLQIKNNSVKSAGTVGISMDNIKTWLDTSGNSINDYSVLATGNVGLNISNLFSGINFWEYDNKIVSVTAGGGAAKAVTGTSTRSDTVTTVCPSTDKISSFNAATGVFTCTADVSNASGATTFPGLTDVPDTILSANASKVLQVNSAGNAVEAGQNLNTTANARFASIGVNTTAGSNGTIAVRNGGQLLLEAGATGTSYMTVQDMAADQGAIYKVNNSGTAYIDITPLVTDTASAAFLRFFRTTNTSGAVGIDIHRGTNAFAINDRIGANGDSYFQALVGNFGIGNTAPGEKLEVSGNIKATNGQFVSTKTTASGLPPLVVASTNNVANLNASSLNGATFAAPGAIGGTTPAAITGTTITATGNITAKQFIETAPATVSATGTLTIDLANGQDQEFDTTGNTTFVLPTPVAGQSFTLTVKYGGAHTITWPASGIMAKWAGGTVPTATSVSGKYDIYVFKALKDLSAWIGGDGGRNF